MRIDSALPLPELVAAEGEADATIRFGHVEQRQSATGEQGCLSATKDEAYLFWEDVGAFLVRKGCEIIIDPAPRVSTSLLRLLILGQPLAALLYQRGLLVLHASTVAIADKGAVSFMGEWGEGKSTMAAAMHVQGHSLVADDVTAVRADGTRPVVYPGFPQFKLWPESAVALGDEPEALPLLVPNYYDKRARRADEGFSLDPLPLKCIYILDEGEAPEVTPIAPQEALAELMSHSTGTLALQFAGVASHFPQYGSLVRSVAVRRLKRPRSLPDLPRVTQLVEEDLSQYE